MEGNKKNKIKEITLKIINIISYIFSILFVALMIFCIVDCNGKANLKQDTKKAYDNNLQSYYRIEDNLDDYLNTQLSAVVFGTTEKQFNVDNFYLTINDGVQTEPVLINKIGFRKWNDNNSNTNYVIMFWRESYAIMYILQYNTSTFAKLYYWTDDVDYSTSYYSCIVQANLDHVKNSIVEQENNNPKMSGVAVSVNRLIDHIFKEITIYDIQLGYNWYPSNIGGAFGYSENNGYYTFVGSQADMWHDNYYSLGMNGIFYSNGQWFKQIRVYPRSVAGWHYVGGDINDINSYVNWGTENVDDLKMAYILYYYTLNNVPIVVATIASEPVIYGTTTVYGYFPNKWTWTSDEYKHLTIYEFKQANSYHLTTNNFNWGYNWNSWNGANDGGYTFLTSSNSNLIVSYLSSSTTLDSYVGLATSSVNNLSSIFNMTLVGGITFGTLIFAPLVSGIIVLIIRSVKK